MENRERLGQRVRSFWFDQSTLQGAARGAGNAAAEGALQAPPRRPAPGGVARPARQQTGFADGLACLLLLAVALFLGTHQAAQTGALWPDGPRYSNAAAMIHDWLVSGELLHPYEFAKRNYCQYPAFNIPFHPPLYPA